MFEVSVSVRSRNGAPSKGMRGQWSNDQGQQQMSSRPPPSPPVVTVGVEEEDQDATRSADGRIRAQGVREQRDGDPAIHRPRPPGVQEDVRKMSVLHVILYHFIL